MNAAEIILEIVRYTTPAALVFILVFLILKQFFDHQLRKSSLDIRRLNQQAITPMRLHAYERVTLLMERISPVQLVMRMSPPKGSKTEFQSSLINTIRSEYEHNLTQQIYISRGAWETVKKAKEESIKIINMAAARLPEDASAMDLAKTIIESGLSVEKWPTDIAIDILKQEVRTLY